MSPTKLGSKRQGFLIRFLHYLFGILIVFSFYRRLFGVEAGFRAQGSWFQGLGLGFRV